MEEQNLVFSMFHHICPLPLYIEIKDAIMTTTFPFPTITKLTKGKKKKHILLLLDMLIWMFNVIKKFT